MLTVSVQDRGDAVVLRCVGRVVAGENIRLLRDAVMCQVDKHLVVLDLTAVDAIDAAGLGLFIFLQTLAVVAGNELKLMNLTERTQELLAITKLDSVFGTRTSGDAQLRIERGHDFASPSPETRLTSPEWLSTRN